MSTRREFLRALAALGAAGAVPACTTTRPRFAADPFALGVASGYPTPSGFVLWTRLAPDPMRGDGGLDPVVVPVRWEVATDDSMRNIVAAGTAQASPDWAHAVHVEIAGLEPERWYAYRFSAGEAQSAVGRARTAPPASAPSPRLRFAFASCQQYEHGHYGAYRHVVADSPDLVAFLGDYIYESSWGRNHVRKHGAGEPYTLDEYRARYALYKGDPDLQAAHAACPWIATWDDHEVDNDYADDRQYRSHQACPRAGRAGGSSIVDAAACAAIEDPARTMLGTAQERWLEESLAASGAGWNLIAQQTLMAQLDQSTRDGRRAWTDGWDGYPAARRRLLDALAARRVANPVVIGGDVHMFYVSDLKSDFDDPGSPVVASEFVGTSITSQGPAQKRVDARRARNPHLHFADSRYRGYVRVEVTPERLRADLRALDTVERPDTSCRTLASFAVESGRPGPQRA